MLRFGQVRVALLLCQRARLILIRDPAKIVPQSRAALRHLLPPRCISFSRAVPLCSQLSYRPRQLLSTLLHRKQPRLHHIAVLLQANVDLATQPVNRAVQIV